MMEVRVQLFHSAKLVTICSTAFLLIFVASHLLLSPLPFSLLGFMYFYVFMLILAGFFRKENMCVRSAMLNRSLTYFHILVQITILSVLNLYNYTPL